MRAVAYRHQYPAQRGAHDVAVRACSFRRGLATPDSSARTFSDNLRMAGCTPFSTRTTANRSLAEMEQFGPNLDSGYGAVSPKAATTK